MKSLCESKGRSSKLGLKFVRGRFEATSAGGNGVEVAVVCTDVDGVAAWAGGRGGEDPVARREVPELAAVTA